MTNCCIRFTLLSFTLIYCYITTVPVAFYWASSCTTSWASQPIDCLLLIETQLTKSWLSCVCYLHRFSCLKVFIQGRKNLNRAVSDDVVAVEILPQEDWSCPSSLLVEDVEDKPAGSDGQETVWCISYMFKLGTFVHLLLYYCENYTEYIVWEKLFLKRNKNIKIWMVFSDRLSNGVLQWRGALLNEWLFLTIFGLDMTFDLWLQNVVGDLCLKLHLSCKVGKISTSGL